MASKKGSRLGSFPVSFEGSQEIPAGSSPTLHQVDLAGPAELEGTLVLSHSDSSAGAPGDGPPEDGPPRDGHREAAKPSETVSRDGFGRLRLDRDHHGAEHEVDLAAAVEGRLAETPHSRASGPIAAPSR